MLYITFISKASFCFIYSLYPQAVFILATPIPLNTYLSEKQSELIILLFLFKAGRQKAHLLWGTSSRNTASLPPSLPILAHHSSPRHWDIPQWNRYAQAVMFTTQKDRKRIYKKLQYKSLNILDISVWKEHKIF